MRSDKVSIKYATTLLDSAAENNKLDAVTNDASFLLEALRSHGEFKRTLASPIIKNELKSAILKDVLAERVSKEFMDFISFIVKKDRVDVLYGIMEAFFELRNKKLGITHVVLSSAVELDDSQVSSIKERLESVLDTTIEFEKKLDASLVGGFIAKAGDIIYDASLVHQLKLLKKQFVSSGSSVN